MKNQTKSLIDEMIFLKTNWREQNFETLIILKKAIEKMSAKSVYLCVGSILLWPKKYFLFQEIENDNIASKVRFEIDKGLEAEPEYNRFSSFFQLCPDIAELLVLHKNEVTFSDELSEEEKDEIFEYIEQNFKERIRRTTRTRRNI